MKNHIDSNFAIAILALVSACVGFAFWFNADSVGGEFSQHQIVNLHQKSHKNIPSSEALIPKDINPPGATPPVDVQDVNPPTIQANARTAREVEVEQFSQSKDKALDDAWEKFEHEESGVYFSYKSTWGEPVLSQDFGDDPALSIGFKENRHLYGMMMSSNFRDSGLENGRGGSLTMDSLSFERGEEYIKHSFRDIESQKEDWKTYKYITSQSGLCGYSTNLIFFESSVFHAVCNTENPTLPTITLATNQHNNSVTAEDFTRMIESFGLSR